MWPFSRRRDKEYEYKTIKSFSAQALIFEWKHNLFPNGWHIDKGGIGAAWDLKYKLRVKRKKDRQVCRLCNRDAEPAISPMHQDGLCFLCQVSEDIRTHETRERFCGRRFSG